MSSTLGAALAFARRGYAVLPLTWPVAVNGRLRCSCRRAADCTAPAKHPLGRLVPTGLLSASLDEAVIRQWFTDEPAANLGVVTDKLIVLDIDPRHDGETSLAALERDHGFPPSWRVRTGGGGAHLIFSCPDGVAVGSSSATSNPLLGPGIDIRAKNGYVVAVPSRHLSGRAYSWSVDHHPRDVPLAEAPAWLIEGLTAGKQPSGIARRDAAQWAIERAGLIREYRDLEVARVAGKLLRAISIDPAFARTLIHDWNTCHCDPPLPEREVAAIIERIARREIARLEKSNA
jgi:hypothetical protein